MDACLFCCCFCFSFSLLRQEIGWEERLQNCPFCVWLDVKPESISESIKSIQRIVEFGFYNRLQYYDHLISILRQAHFYRNLVNHSHL